METVKIEKSEIQDSAELFQKFKLPTYGRTSMLKNKLIME